MRKKALVVGLILLTAMAVTPPIVPTASAISDLIECDDYHNGGGMDADCANHIFYMMAMGQMGENWF